MKQYILATCLLIASFIFACDGFLDKKSDIKLSVPKTLDDATSLLNDYATMNSNYPIWGELGIDDYYVTKAVWEASSILDQRNAYVWADELYTNAVQWQSPYKAVYYANQVLEVLDKVDMNEDIIAYKRNRGGAHFYRAFAFQTLAEVHCAAYQSGTASSEMGIPLRLMPGIDEPSVRASLQATYEQILLDFKTAAQLLPAVEAVRGRPSKAAAYAGVARAYLNMGDFEQAYRYADSSLQISQTLLDYNTLKATDGYPIPKGNIEIQFLALSANTGLMGSNNALIADDLYQSYGASDLRKVMFFKSSTNPVNSFLFKGSYDQNGAQLFVGITTSEVYLIKAEAAARINRVSESLAALNALLRARYDKSAPVTITETNSEDLLCIVLTERRKELVLRGRSWSDLKRLNVDARFQKTLMRQLGTDVYKLEPNDRKYAFRLVETLIRVGGIPQNIR